MPPPVRVLFVCIGNSCRSQMAEALARHLASDVIAPSSGGLYPFCRIADPTRMVLLERGITIEGQFSKGLHDDSIPQPPARVINMSGQPVNSHFAGIPIEDWTVEDPFGDDVATYRRICDDIEARVRDLAARLRTHPKNAASRRRARKREPAQS